MHYQAYKQISERVKLAREALVSCNLCPHSCGVDRTAGQKGKCGLDDTVRCFRQMLYCGEENELNPSHQINFAGCNLRCEFCVVAEWNQTPTAAQEVDFDDLAMKIAAHQDNGARTVNILGGEPAVNVHGILELLACLKPQIKVVWNSNMYYNELVDKLTMGLVDVYLADFKCGNNQCSQDLLGVNSYLEVVTDNILKAAEHADVIIRHVVMPGHRQCCLEPLLMWVARKLPAVKVSLRDNYVPPVEAALAPAGYLRQEEMRTAVGFAEKMGLNLIR